MATQSGAVSQEYFKRQLASPYRSTVKFCEFLRDCGVSPEAHRKVADLGCGVGASLFYTAKQFPLIDFVGFDYNRGLIEQGNNIGKELDIKNVTFEFGDILKFEEKNKSRFDGLISLQTLSWLYDWQEPLQNMVSFNPQWIALSSLFYNDYVSAKTAITDYTDKSSGKAYNESFYNTYSLPIIGEFLKKQGYSHFLFTPFEIDIDLTKPEHQGMGTETVRLDNGKRLQISGPLLMNWYFIFASK